MTPPQAQRSETLIENWGVGGRNPATGIRQRHLFNLRHRLPDLRNALGTQRGVPALRREPGTKCEGGEMARSYAKSRELYERAGGVLAGGVSSEFRKYNQPHPLFYSHGKGSRIWDVEGHEYLD